MNTINMPGFTAEQGLRQYHGTYLQRSAGRPEGAGDVHPQFFKDFICKALSKCCINDISSGSSSGCCRSWSEFCLVFPAPKWPVAIT